MLFGPNQGPGTIFAGEFATDFIGSIVIGNSGREIVGLSNVKPASGILENINPKHRKALDLKHLKLAPTVNPDESGLCH